MTTKCNVLDFTGWLEKIFINGTVGKIWIKPIGLLFVSNYNYSNYSYIYIKCPNFDTFTIMTLMKYLGVKKGIVAEMILQWYRNIYRENDEGNVTKFQQLVNLGEEYMRIFWGNFATFLMFEFIF